MVRINSFEVEQWMDLYETTPGVLNIAETCAASISVDELTQLAVTTGGPASNPLDSSVRLTYGAIRGSHALRERLALLCSGGPGAEASPLSVDNILITQGAIGANFLVFYTLIGPGDHCICVYPTYQQLFAVPESLGAQVSLWRLKPENGFVPDPSELEGLVKDNTKVRSAAPRWPQRL